MHRLSRRTFVALPRVSRPPIQGLHHSERPSRRGSCIVRGRMATASHTRVHALAVTAIRIAGSLGGGYLLHPQAPNWRRWLSLAACQVVLAGVAARLRPLPEDALARIALKTALWPALAAGLAGVARLLGFETYHVIEGM